jgi:hypothetical protein
VIDYSLKKIQQVMLSHDISTNEMSHTSRTVLTGIKLCMILLHKIF